MANIKMIKKWEIVGAIISVVLGSLLHFVFEWSGNNKIVGIFGAINESTWEHLKLAFWPTFFFAILEWLFWGRENINFCFATFIKLISMPIIIIVLFYGWLAFFPDNFVYDVSIFVIAVVVGYFLSYKIIKSKCKCGFEVISKILITILLILFSTFTYFPPKSILTTDPTKLEN